MLEFLLEITGLQSVHISIRDTDIGRGAMVVEVDPPIILDPETKALPADEEDDDLERNEANANPNTQLPQPIRRALAEIEC